MCIRDRHTVLPNLKEVAGMLSTFLLVLLGFIFFRTESILQAWEYMQRIFYFDMQIELLQIGRYSFEMIPLLLMLVSVEWIYRKQEFPLGSSRYEYIKTIGILLMILIFGSFSNLQEFIYFQF